MESFYRRFVTNMIFGYVSKTGYPKLENYFEECYPQGVTFRYKCDKRKAYFFRRDTDFGLCPTYYDSNSLILCEGIPIRGSPDNGYELVNTISKEDIRRGFHNFIDEIVSNVSMVFFKNGNNPKLYLSSDRAAINRIYYRFIDKGIAFSSSFSVLLHFAPLRTNCEAVYSILKFGYAPPPLTLSKQIHCVPPSHYIVVDVPKMEIYRYPYFKFCFSEEHGFNLKRLNHILDAYSEILSRMNSCLLISGGVDSTLLAHKMSERYDKNIRSYFLAFGKKDPELVFAKEASGSLGSHLDVIYMDESRLCEIIDEIAASYDHPFNDGSVIPTYFLMKHVVHEGEKIIVDGTGADGCFGFETIASEIAWKFAYSLPTTFKKLISLMYSQSGIWKRASSLEKIFRTITKCLETDVNLGPLVGISPNNVFSSNFTHDETIGRLSMSLVNKLTSPCCGAQVFKQRATVADIIFTCGAWAAAKTNLRNKFPQVYTLYPFLWKDILEEQSRISWSAKVNNGIVKWPLKKLLEPYMPRRFIYRKKSGFTPNLESYIKNEKVYRLIKKTFSNPNIVDRFVNKKSLDELTENLPIIKGYSIPLRAFVWGLLFVESWISKHSRNYLPT